MVRAAYIGTIWQMLVFLKISFFINIRQMVPLLSALVELWTLISFTVYFQCSVPALCLQRWLQITALSVQWFAVAVIVREGQCLSARDKEQCWGGHRWASQEEDGTRPPCHSEDGHDWTHGVESWQLQCSQVSTTSVLHYVCLQCSVCQRRNTFVLF